MIVLCPELSYSAQGFWMVRCQIVADPFSIQVWIPFFMYGVRGAQICPHGVVDSRVLAFSALSEKKVGAVSLCL